LPHPEAADLDRLLSGADADRFSAEPLWQGTPRESSPYTRCREQALVRVLTRELGNGLLPRLAAQLVELASLSERLDRAGDRPDDPIETAGTFTQEGVGIAMVPAARGLLVHRIALDQGRIREYRILAPTEWNFHPRGVVQQGLANLLSTRPETLRRQADLFVTAVDPCVDYHLTVT
jgi:coenzyme F420-reducing hydrogenase alpha subunit